MASAGGGQRAGAQGGLCRWLTRIAGDFSALNLSPLNISCGDFLWHSRQKLDPIHGVYVFKRHCILICSHGYCSETGLCPQSKASVSDGQAVETLIRTEPVPELGRSLGSFPSVLHSAVFSFLPSSPAFSLRRRGQGTAADA